MKTFCIRRSTPWLLFLAGALLPAHLLAQGQVTVNFNNRVLSGPYQVNAPIFGPNGSGLLGSGFTAALYAGPAGITDPGQLSFVANTTFRSSVTLAGFVMPVTALPSLPTPADTFTFQVRAWDNRLGTVTSWAQVLGDPNVPRGNSGMFTPPPQPGASSIVLVGLNSFVVGFPETFPQILQQPQGTNIALGDKLSLSVIVGVMGPSTVQWRLYGTNLPGETNLTLVRNQVRFEDAGPYTVNAINSGTSVNSQEAMVSIPPRLLQPRPAGTGAMALPFESAPGRPVSLEMKPSLPLTGGPWTILATTNSVTVRSEFLDAHATDPKRYYRLRLQP